MEGEKLDKAINVRVSTRLYDAIQRLARRERRKTADWARVVLEERVSVEEQAGQEQARQSGR